MLSGKKIVLAVTGSIAAYKTAYLVRLLVRENAEVKVVMTSAAKDFITPLTMSTLSKNPVLCDPFEEGSGEWHSHVDLGTWADMLIIAPATANTLAKMAHGIADNYLLTVYLSARCPVLFAPAMDLDMYNHPATKANICKLETLGHQLIEPQVGELASGLCGAGRMEEPEKILDFVVSEFNRSQDLKNQKILITAGPTYEAIDPVRFIGNFSSGKMGFAIAENAAKRGAEIILVTGPTHCLVDHPNIKRIDVITAHEMYEECHRIFDETNITIMCAAVADYTPEKPSGKKIKKEGDTLEIKLSPTRDILASLGKLKRDDQLLVGFALETNNEVENAVKKIQNKNLDFIVLNSLRDKGAGFGTPTNKITIIDRNGKSKSYDLKPKEEVAMDIIDTLVYYLNH